MTRKESPSEGATGGRTGMTPVHVNRTFRALEERGLIARTARYIAVHNRAD